MAIAVSIAPLALAVAVRTRPASPPTSLLVAASLLWLVAGITYRGFSGAHDRWRRKMLRQEISAARKARLDSSEVFQDRLNEQSAILDRIVDLSETVLSEGITDPSRTLASVRLLNAHALEAQGLVADAIAEVRVETGSQTFERQPIDVRVELEQVVAPFIRGGRVITTSGAQHFAETDPAVFRVLIRGLVTRAIELGAETIDAAVARDGALVLCTVADDGPDRSGFGLADLTPLATSLAAGVNGEFEYTRALGWNQFSLCLPVGIPPTTIPRRHDPLDVLGRVKPSQAPPPAPPSSGPAAGLDRDMDLPFGNSQPRDRSQTVAARRKTPAPTR